MPRYVMAIDQGTTSSRAIIFDEKQNVICSAQREFKQYYPREGWVEHDPMEIFLTVGAVMAEAVEKSGVGVHDVAAIGITNQRETTIVWDKATGEPVYNAIVWQCRRTADICNDLEKRGLAKYIKDTTGLVIDAYFSGTKIKWILDNVPGAREKAERGELLFGTVDTWLLWKLTGGRVHATDVTNASRTMMFDIHGLCWDKKLLGELTVPESMLPEVRSSGEIYGYCSLMGAEIPIAGMAGDQQAALFGQCCFEKGDAKNTYGTGCFLLMNTGETAVESKNGLVTTVAACTGGKVQYALEGSVFVGGAVMQWLRDELHMIESAADAGKIAASVPDTGGVYLVPAFTGLGAPHWDMYARGAIVGITRGTKREHIVRAAEESIAYQVRDIVSAMESDAGQPLRTLNVDGGAARDKFLLQFQSDILGKPVSRPEILETTALGAALLAGIAVGVWKSLQEIKAMRKTAAEFECTMDEDHRRRLVAGWNKALGRSLDWEEHA